MLSLRVTFDHFSSCKCVCVWGGVIWSTASCVVTSRTTAPLQSIAEANRSSSGAGPKPSSLDGSVLDSSHDTDSGSPFCSPTPAVRPNRPASELDDR